MTTFTVTYPYTGLISDDTTFRRAISDYRGLLTGCGLVKVAVTGEVDVGTVTYPSGTNVVAGFDIFRFNDPLQDSAPIFLRIDYGRTSSGGSFGIWVSLGTSVSSSGVLGGALSGRLGTTNYVDNAPTGNSFSCHTDGFFGAMNRPAGTNSSSYPGSGTFAVCRTCDANGYPTADGVYIMCCGYPRAYAQSIRFTGVPGAVSAVSTAVFDFPLGVSSSVGGDVPFYPLWMPMPELIPVFGLAAYPDQLISTIDFADIAMVGSRVRRYVMGPQTFTGRSSVNPAYAMLWE